MDEYSDQERIDFALGELQAVKNTLLALIEALPDRRAFYATFQRNSEQATSNNLTQHLSEAFLDGHDHMIEAVNRLDKLLSAQQSTPQGPA